MEREHLMRIIFAYLSVVIIWSTTPLAIQWSSTSFSFSAAVMFRMVFALLICLVALCVTRKPLIKSSSDWLVFCVGALGLFPNMVLVYWAAQYISSGVMSVLFGVYPFLVGFFSIFILKENIFNRARILALLLATVGVVLVQYEHFHVGDNAVYGILAMLIATISFALSSVWLKSIGKTMEPLRQLTGVLLLATPCFMVCWWFMDGVIPQSIDMKSILAVAYLVIAGSVIGGTMFYIVLKQCSVLAISFITLLTPIIAICLGVVFAGEKHGYLAVFGCFMVMFSLALYQGVLYRFYKKVRWWCLDSTTITS